MNFVSIIIWIEEMSKFTSLCCLLVYRLTEMRFLIVSVICYRDSLVFFFFSGFVKINELENTFALCFCCFRPRSCIVLFIRFPYVENAYVSQNTKYAW